MVLEQYKFLLHSLPLHATITSLKAFPAYKVLNFILSIHTNYMVLEKEY